uniref:Uncharacterized protein n=1 Tax=Anguilla anguilla TaxID=7936 RepID=A0A0E9WLV5_ANGAN
MSPTGDNNVFPGLSRILQYRTSVGTALFFRIKDVVSLTEAKTSQG